MLGSGKNRSTLPHFSLLTFSFSLSCLSIFFLFSFLFFFRRTFLSTLLLSATEFQHSKPEVLFDISFFYFVLLITPFDGSYKKVPFFYLRLFSQKFDSCVVW